MVVAWILGMQECGFSITLQQLKMKVVELTQTKPTPFKHRVEHKNSLKNIVHNYI
jgi:hypothetical protein